MSSVIGGNERLRVEVGPAIREAAGRSTWNDDGTVNLVLARPTGARSRSRRLLEADMLRRNARAFQGWPIYLMPDTEQAKRRRQGLPRPVSDLGGQVRGSLWDGSYVGPDDERLGIPPGAVIGRCALVDLVESLVRRVPDALRLTADCVPTRVREGTVAGRKGLIVEGIVADPEEGAIVLTTGASRGSDAHRAVMEAAREAATRTTGGVPMRLQEAALSPRERIEQWEEQSALAAAAAAARRSVRAGGRVREAAASPVVDREALRRRLLDPTSGTTVSRGADMAMAVHDPELRSLVHMSDADRRELGNTEAAERRRAVVAEEDRQVREAETSVQVPEAAREYRDSLVRQGLDPVQFGLPEAWR